MIDGKANSLTDSYIIEMLDHGPLNLEDDNVDVFVYFNDGRKYVATFFTLKNIEAIMRKDHETGECAGGLYFWSTDMIVVKRLDRATIEKTVSDLLASGEFEKAFDGPHPIDS